LKIARKGGKLICFDADEEAITAAKAKLENYEVRFIHDNFANMANHGIEPNSIDGILMDLGVSSHQLDTAERGFSFHEDAPLNMRMNNNGSEYGISAHNVVNDYPPQRLTEILFEYGEEKYARRIVQAIVAARNAAEIKTTFELAEIIRNNVPISVRNAKNPCRKTFQAIRIEVNDELGSLTKGIETGFRLLKPAGRFAVITFHSLEDRLVKKAFAKFTAGCECPKSLPLCVCGKEPQSVAITRKPITANETELEQNRRARSAKLRVISKV
jgi:16S rRNA (cytosine1402-N4)-methyltransferase